MSNAIVDWVLCLFRDETKAQVFLRNPEGALRDAGLGQCTPAQIHAVVATAAPVVTMGGGDPVVGLQRAVANHHGIAQQTFAPTFQPQQIVHQEAHTDLSSHHAVDVASPTTIVDNSHDVSLDFGDFTFGNKTTAVGAGAVAVGGDLNGRLDASNTDVEDSFNTDNSMDDVDNTTDSHNETDSHSSTTEVTGIEGGDIGALLPGI